MVCYIGRPQNRNLLKRQKQKDIIQPEEWLRVDNTVNPKFGGDSISIKYEYLVTRVCYYKRFLFQSPEMVSMTYPYEITGYYNPKNSKGVF